MSFSRLVDRPIIELPRLFDVKLNAIDHIAENLKKLQLKGEVALLSGNRTYNVAGKRVQQILEDTGYSVHNLNIKEATTEEARRAMEFYKEVGATFAVAVGGGKVIDVCKFSSFEYDIPFVSVPTAASHDGIASARASLYGVDVKGSFPSKAPILVVGDIATLAKAPKRFTISGCADVISNKTAIMDWELSRRITGEHKSSYASTLAEISAISMIEAREEIAKDPIKGAYHVFKGLITSSMAMCIEGSSRPASGAEHLISHSLDQLVDHPALHGEQVGMMSIFTMYLHGGNWQEIKETLEIIGAPIKASQIGVEPETLVKAILMAQSIRPERYTILSTGVTRRAVIKALERTGIIEEDQVPKDN
ncbi:MAG: iron-containing alcohol dehydrogenase [Methanobacteriota archaeon]|nr:MAG: iron-containing alcohol dehydrogenase [Euryarchaeota archaeon]